MAETIAFTVNGKAETVTSDPDRPLLEVLREDLKLTGTKFGCGEGACRACTVLLDGKPVTSCNLPVSRVAGKKVVTVEGLASGKPEEGTFGYHNLHAVQQAFLDEQAFQCGYCTPGMIMATVALLDGTPNPTDEQIAAALEGHICRCGGYPRIVKAVRRAAKAGRRQTTMTRQRRHTRMADARDTARPAHGAGLSRRNFLQVLGAGIVISVTASGTIAQQRRRRPGPGRLLAGAGDPCPWPLACTSAPTARSPS